MSLCCRLLGVGFCDSGMLDVQLCAQLKYEELKKKKIKKKITVFSGNEIEFSGTREQLLLGEDEEDPLGYALVPHCDCSDTQTSQFRTVLVPLVVIPIPKVMKNSFAKSRPQIR